MRKRLSRIFLSTVAAALRGMHAEGAKKSNKQMARYTGPKTKIARKFGEAIYGEDRVLAKKNYPPGQHGNNRRRKTSEYGQQLKEKQKAKYTYAYSVSLRR